MKSAITGALFRAAYQKCYRKPANLLSLEGGSPAILEGDGLTVQAFAPTSMQWIRISSDGTDNKDKVWIISHQDSGEEESCFMKTATIFIAFGLFAGIMQGIINTLAGIETSKGLKGIVYNLPTYALGVLVGYYVLRH